MKPRAGMHSLIQICLLGINVTIKIERRELLLSAVVIPFRSARMFLSWNLELLYINALPFYWIRFKVRKTLTTPPHKFARYRDSCFRTLYEILLAAHYMTECRIAV